MKDKYMRHMYHELTRSIGEVKSLEGAATLVINYIYNPVDGERARKLWDFALSIGYVPVSNIEPKFLRERYYCFGLIQDHDDAVRIYPIRTEMLMPKREIDRWRVHNGKKHSK